MFAKVSKSVHSPIVHITLLLLSIQYSSSAPIETIYAKFISDMNSNKCTTPEQMKLPLNSSAAESYEYLSSYLKICQDVETIERYKEALYLCREILDNLKVILCPPISVKVIVNPANLTLSKQVCKDVGSLKDAVPENKVILKRLTDSVNCEIMCEGVFEKACRVLLWSYQLQKQSEKAEIPNKEAKENSLQIEIKAVPDESKLPEQNKVTQTAQKTTVAEEILIAGKAKQSSANDLISNIQKTSTVVKQQAQNQVPEHQIDLESNLQNPAHTTQKDPSTNNIPSLYRNNLSRNNSLEPGSKLPQVEDTHGNDLPENDIESPNAGLAEQEDPHDNEEQLPYNIDVAVPNANVVPSQNLDDKKSSGLPVADDTPNLPNVESPDVPVKDESHLQAELLQPPANEGLVDPHDEEEPGEEDRAEIDPKAKVPVSETSKLQDKIDTPSMNKEQPKTTIQNVAIIKEGSTAGNTKNLIATDNKKVDADVKTSPVGEAQSTDGRKTTERPSSLPSQEGVDSSVAPPANEDSSPTLEKMEGEDDVHEMPEDREPDQDTGLENTEGDPGDDYRQDYDGGNYDPAKNKEISPDKPNQVEVPKVDVMRPREPNFNDFSPRDKYGRQSEGLAVFPDQEDGHFFFYFLSIVLILMAGYLLFHNKQKIIALIVEGRHERRRRSHGVGYKKLETK